MTAWRRSAHARLDALEAALASYVLNTTRDGEQVRRRLETVIGDARSLLNIRSETGDYLVPFALMVVESAERQFAHAQQTLRQIP